MIYLTIYSDKATGVTIEADDLAKANAAYGDHSNNYLAINIPVDLDEDGTATVTVDAPMKAGTHSLTYIVSEAVNDAMLTAVTTSSGTADTLTVKAGAPNSIDEGGDKTLTEKLTVTSNATPHNVSFGKQHCVKMQITVENPHIFYPRVH